MALRVRQKIAVVGVCWWLLLNLYHSTRASRELSMKQEALAPSSDFSVQQSDHRDKNRRRTVRNQTRPVLPIGKRRRSYTQTVPPKKESLSSNATFSACLILKDDNDILPEFLAYHFHSVRLRRLVVAVDPHSETSPRPILERWNNYMNITVWEEKNYMPKEFMESYRTPTKYRLKHNNKWTRNQTETRLVENHFYRQQVFLARCMEFLRQEGSTWVMHIDTDEYLTTSKLLREQPPSHIDIVSAQEPGSVLTVLQQAVRHSYETVNYPCIPVIRILYGNKELPKQPSVEGFSPQRFESLRWNYHASTNVIGSGTVNALGKFIIDVTAIPKRTLKEPVVLSIHRPFGSFCSRSDDMDYSHVAEQPMAINHYLGSWEQYSRRADPRRTRTAYQEKALEANLHRDDGLKEWLSGFVASVGVDMARKLLGDSYRFVNDEPK